MWCERVFEFLKRHSTVPGAVVVFAITYVVMLAVNAGEVGAAWVQAIGSILALVGAAVLPVFHARVSAKQAERESIQLLSTFAHHAFDMLSLLNRVFEDESKWYERATSYLDSASDKEWNPLLLALTQMPLERFTAANALNLMVVRDVVHLAAEVAGTLVEWKVRGYVNKRLTEPLEGKIDVLAMVLQELPPPEHKLPMRW